MQIMYITFSSLDRVSISIITIYIGLNLFQGYPQVKSNLLRMATRHKYHGLLNQEGFAIYIKNVMLSRSDTFCVLLDQAKVHIIENR